MKKILLKTVVVVLCAACHHEAPPSRSRPLEFKAEGSLLYRVDSAGRMPLLALDSATAPAGVPVLPSVWTPQAGSTFGVAAKAFRHMTPSPGGEWVAWESNGAVHDLIGITPGRGGRFTVVDFYFDSAADSLKWTSERLVNAYYMPPSGIAEVRVYDAILGKRIK